MNSAEHKKFLLRKLEHSVGCVLPRIQFDVEDDAWVQAPTLQDVSATETKKLQVFAMYASCNLVHVLRLGKDDE